MKKIVKNPLVLLAVGVLVVAGSSVGATRAAITYSSRAEQVDFSTSELSVEIQELQGSEYVAVGKSEKEVNNAAGTVADSLTFPAIAADMMTNDDDKSNDRPFTVGKKYDENVRVVNTSAGGYDEYVRVFVRTSWKDANGKNTILDPKLINLEYADGWYTDTTENTDAEAHGEGYAMYLAKPLAYGESADLIKSITIDNEVLTYVKTVGGTEKDGKISGVVTDEYQYNGKTFYVEIRVDAVQTHNAEDAILGAWGVHANVNESGVITSINGAAVN